MDNIPIYCEPEQWLRHVLNETPAYLWMTDADRNKILVSKPLAGFLGTGGEMLPEEWRIYCHPDDVERVSETFSKSLALQSEYSDEARLRRLDGQYRWVNVIAHPRFSPQSKLIGYTGSLIDITERRLAEQNARESAELMEGHNRVLELVVKNTPLHKILDELVRVIEARSPDMLGSILLLDSDGLHLRHGAAPSLPESYNSAIDGRPIGPAAGSCGTATLRREPVIVEDIATDPLWQNYREFALQHGLRACWSTPIFGEKEGEQQPLLGTFALYFRSPRLPSKWHRKLIEMATHAAAIAIVKTRESEALRKSEERLRLATSYGKLGIWEWQINNDRLIWSDELKALFGWPKEPTDLNIRMFLDVIHPQDRDSLEASIQVALAQHVDHDVEYRICLEDGSIRWIASHGRAEYGAEGQPLRMLGVAREITQRKYAEEEIHRREAQLVEAQRIAHIGSYEWDVRANKVYRSAELCNIFGVPGSEFEPTFDGYLKRVHAEDRSSTKDIIEQSFRECKPFDHEERIVRPDGSVRVLWSQGKWLCEEGGHPLKLIGICQDITEQKQAKQQLQAANTALAQELKERARTEKEIRGLSARLINAQEEERSRLARELHDDFSQQIAALSVALSNLKRAIPSEVAEARLQSERIREKLGHLAESVRRMSHSLHPAILQYCGLDAALREYCSEFARLAQIQIAFRADCSFASLPPAIAVCAYRVTQEALRNIVKHAQVCEAQVELASSEKTLKLRITDSGIGMDLNMAMASGGLGLTSMRERARLVNGIIDLQSRPGRGTTVTLSVPLTPEPVSVTVSQAANCDPT